jgi:hypothetical protein
MAWPDKNEWMTETSAPRLEVMVGVTTVQNAPPEVCRWLEQERLASFGLQQGATAVGAPQLASRSMEEIALVLSPIQGMLQVVNGATSRQNATDPRYAAFTIRTRPRSFT